MSKFSPISQAVVPTSAEYRLLETLWRIGQGTIDEILKASREKETPNYKTVQTLLRIMERKGLASHQQSGRAFVFRPLVERSDVRRRSIRHFLADYFTGSPAELLMQLVSDKQITPRELRQLETQIRARRKR